MRLTSLKIRSFRNHRESVFEFGQGANVLLGDNGQGKTNVLEAISYLCLTKSFYATSDSLAVMIGADLFEVEGDLQSDTGREAHARVAYQISTGEKVVTVNRNKVEPFSSIIGRFPIVISSPEHGPITSGGPAERRRFIDFVISQASTSYLHALMEFRRVLKQRNKILLDAKIARRDSGDAIAPWDEQLVEYGSALIELRARFVAEFREQITSAYRQLAGEGEEPSIVYEPSVDAGDPEALRIKFRKAMEENAGEERRAGTTLVGPHRDELHFALNGRELRKYASQGQHKTFLVALKIGEWHYLRDRCGETPVMLLDDIFSELDEQRARRLLTFVSELSQTFITSTNPHYFTGFLRPRHLDKTFQIHEGAVAEHQHEAV
jgi:DNA replication and repair protein RecF